jgi:hypothetical protein
MTFIGILLALAAERALGHLPRVGEPMVLEQLMVRLQRAVPLAAYWRSWASPVVLLGAGTALAGALDWWIRHASRWWTSPTAPWCCSCAWARATWAATSSG